MNGVKELRALTVPSREKVSSVWVLILLLYFSQGKARLGTRVRVRKDQRLSPLWREKMFCLHNYSLFLVGLGSGSLLLLLSSSFLDFSMNPLSLAGLLLSFKELSRRYFLYFLCFLFSVFFSFVSGSCSLLGGSKLYVSALLAGFPYFNSSLILLRTLRVKHKDLIQGAGFIYLI